MEELKIPIPFSEKTLEQFNYRETAINYFNIIYELFTTTFKWEGLPEYMYEEGADLYLENALTINGKVLFFKDDVLNKYLLYTYTGQDINFYGRPISYQVSNPAGYSKKFDRKNAVEIFNSPFRTPENVTIKLYAEKLATCDMILMLNLHTQKMPYLLSTTQGQELTTKNFLNKLNTYEPNIFVDKNFDMESIKVFNLNSPFVGPQIQIMKESLWSEILRYCGITGNIEKAERVNVEEQDAFNGEANAWIMTRLTTRQKAAKDINKKFGLNVKVSIRPDLSMRFNMLDSIKYVNSYFGTGETDDNNDTEKVNDYMDILK